VATLLFTLVLGFLVLVVLGPIVLLVLNSFYASAMKADGLQAWQDLWFKESMRDAIWNTLTLSIVRQGIAFCVGIGIAWLLARTDMRGKHVFEFAFWIAFFMPILPITLGWVLLLDPDFGLINQAARTLLGQSVFDIYSWWGIVWVHLFSKTIATKVMLLTPIFRNMDISLEEAAQTSGATTCQMFMRILLPVMTPAVSAVMILSLIRSLETFEVELFLGVPARIDVYSTLIYRFLRQEPAQYDSATILAVTSLIALLPLVVFQQWLLHRGGYATLTGRYRMGVLRLRGWHWPAWAFVAIIVALTTVVPIAFLVTGTFMKVFGFFTIADPWSTRHWSVVLADPLFSRSLVNTVILGATTALAGVVIYSAVAYISIRSRYRFRRALDFLTWMPSLLPGVLLGLGLLFMFLQVPIFRPLYGSMGLLVLAVLVSGVTIGTQLIKSGLLQIGAELEEGAWASGASWLETCRRVVLPLLAPVVGLVAVITFADATRNISSIVLLSTSGNRPLSLLQLSYMIDGRYEPAAVIGVIVVVITVGLALLIRWLEVKAWQRPA